MYRKSNFAKLNTEELFKSVDTDNSGTISEDEWLNFWTSVLRSGHTEEEISEEVVMDYYVIS
jgi:Ca2+-binding EF-hand superfamily protein